MFYLGNRSGMRTGEIAGLRMSDFSFLDEHVIRLRYSYDNPLKEDLHDQGKVKWAPAADDCADFLRDWLTQRQAAARGPEDYVFPGPKFPNRPCRKEYIEGHWERVRDRLDLGMTWYQGNESEYDEVPERENGCDKDSEHESECDEESERESGCDESLGNEKRM